MKLYNNVRVNNGLLSDICLCRSMMCSDGFASIISSVNWGVWGFSETLLEPNKHLTKKQQNCYDSVDFIVLLMHPLGLMKPKSE